MTTDRVGAPRAIVLLSGGMDSAVVAAMARQQGFEPVALTVDYGQHHAVELDAARAVVGALGIRDHRLVTLDLRAVGGSALTDDALPVPHGRDEGAIGEGVPVTYVPARNALLLTLALGLAEAVGARDLFIGVNAVDYSGYPDCRPEFIAAFEAMAQLATAVGAAGERIRIHAPLSGMSKAQIAEAGQALGVDLALTHTCYDPGPDGLACGSCDACILRARGFAGAGLPDPTRYTTSR